MPGGICGLQQGENNEKRVIFSFWNKDEHSVEVVESGSEVEIETFGGHGTGIKAKENLDWEENQVISFRLSAELMEDFWYCTAKYTVGRDEDWHLLAILKRSVEGGPILQNEGFYSYIEVSTLGQKSSIFPKIHILKISLFTKFTFSKSHFSQN